ncbi:MAG TPA: adenylate/guanylate cyclase domain-containing protein [Afifellaceae bacterium]|nr:adenylate/guanylate cyclase domain-containing protein [Afifellaceae bacterium]
MVRRVPLGVALGGIFGLLIAFGIGLVLSLSIFANYTNTLTLLNARSIGAVNLLEDALTREFGPAEDIVDFLARLFADGQMEFDDIERASAILRGASAGDPDVEAIILYRIDAGTGFGVFRTRDGDYGLIDNEAITNPMIQQQLLEGAPQGKAVWGKPVIVDGSLYANVRRALVRDGETRGYVVAAVPVGLVSARLSAISNAGQATPFILDGSNRVLVHPRLSGEPAIDGARREAVGEAMMNLLAPRLALFEDRVLRRIEERSTIEMFEEAAAANIEVSFLDLSGENEDANNFVLMTRKTSAYSDEPWTLGLYYPAHAVNKEIQRLMKSMVAGIIMLGVAVICAVLLGRRIARPVGRITSVADSVSALELGAIEPLPASRIREFDDGSRTLNKMVEALSAFATYVPRGLVAKLIERGAEESGRPAEAELTVMFTDIAGFTARSETMSAAETAEFLNAHFSALGDAIESCGGTIDKYLGDGLLAFWGAPEPMPDHAARACEAARRIIKVIGEQNRSVEGQGNPPVRMRIGIHSGPTIVGNIGAPSRVNYTVIGDTVNVCARLEQFGKQVDPEADFIVLVSGQTRTLAGIENATESLGDRHLRGREQDISIFRFKP